MVYTSDSETTLNRTTPVDRSVQLPSVSVVIPCLNEERHIGSVLASLARQYAPEIYEIILVDGMSTDRTRDVVEEFVKCNSAIRTTIIDNPKRDIPTALNLGINAAHGDVIVRMDAHSTPSPGYVRRCASLLAENRAAVVGMPWFIQPGEDSLMAKAIALAVAHPFGIGDAQYRLKPESAQFVDTVPFGAFRKVLWTSLGGFNEKLLTNEDYDFNYRVRQAGEKVLLDVEEHCAYSARPTLSALARQYQRYGFWKAQMLKKQIRSLRWRHLVAPVFVLSLLFSFITGFVWSPAWWILLLIVVAYALVSLISAIMIAGRAKTFRVVFLLPLIFFVIHFSWGASFLTGMIIPRRL